MNVIAAGRPSSFNLHSQNDKVPLLGPCQLSKILGQKAKSNHEMVYKRPIVLFSHYLRRSPFLCLFTDQISFVVSAISLASNIQVGKVSRGFHREVKFGSCPAVRTLEVRSVIVRVHLLSAMYRLQYI